jgi:hypothetical protein
MLRNSLISIIIRASMISCAVAVAGGAIVPAVASAKSVTADKAKAIKDRLIHASTMQELVSAMKDAKAAGAPWQMLYESAVFYTIRTSDYSLAKDLMAHLDEYVKAFNVDDSLLCGSETDAAILMHVFIASVALHNGDTETALDHMKEARDLDAETFDALLRCAPTIKGYLNA